MSHKNNKFVELNIEMPVLDFQSAAAAAAMLVEMTAAEWDPDTACSTADTCHVSPLQRQYNAMQCDE